MSIGLGNLFSRNGASPARKSSSKAVVKKGNNGAPAVASAAGRRKKSTVGGDSTSIEGFSVPEAARDYLAVQGRVVLIARGKEGDVLVRNFLGTLNRARVQYEKRSVNISDIATVHRASTKRITHTITESDCIGLVREAVDKRASDIHIHNHQNTSTTTIEFRVNGSLRPIREVSFDDGQALCRTFYGPLASVKDTEWQPTEFQDARISGKGWFPKGVYSARIASTPADDGSRMVIRVLYDLTDAGALSGGIEALRSLGFGETHIECFQQMLGRPTGVNIFSGPTGSGKSTTIKYELERAKERFPDLHLVTVEDPPEYPIRRATQIPLAGTKSRSSEGRREGFSDRIRAAMRLDPDLMMIGEVRDGASAKAAIEAAQTGHKVWTTLHANNAWDILDRYESLLVDVGIQNTRSLLANTSNVSGLIAQRLVKKLCPDCAMPLDEAYREGRVHEDVMTQLLAVFDDIEDCNIRVIGDGCDTCQGHLPPEERKRDPNRGIIGRTVVAETIVPDHELMEIYRTKGPGEAKRFWAMEQGNPTYMDHAISKIRSGIIDPENTIKVVGSLTGQKIAG